MGTVDVSPLTSESVTSFSYYGIGLDRRSLGIEKSFPNLTSFVFQSSTVLYLADVVFLVTNTKAPSLEYLGVEIKVDRKHSYHQFMKDLKKVLLTTPRDHLPNLRTFDILIEREDEYDDDEEEEDEDEDDEDKDDEEEKEDGQDESNRNLRKCIRICFKEGIASIPIHFERVRLCTQAFFDLAMLRSIYLHPVRMVQYLISVMPACGA
ncbi:hypothetical protein ONZ45_g14437 [Pleurotus djamor]|nr:hypothetical protein ONZ45_g14437 [Pleurotus djamor]